MSSQICVSADERWSLVHLIKNSHDEGYQLISVSVAACVLMSFQSSLTSFILKQKNKNKDNKLTIAMCSRLLDSGANAYTVKYLSW